MGLRALIGHSVLGSFCARAMGAVMKLDLNIHDAAALKFELERINELLHNGHIVQGREAIWMIIGQCKQAEWKYDNGQLATRVHPMEGLK